jgi:mRNA-degrading endonuclease YafQ of YafQ-DinJ toxin-antitoxin module
MMIILFHKKFIKQQSKLPRAAQEQLDKKLNVFMENKFDVSLNNHGLNSPYKNCRSINISGDVRAIYEEV